MRILRNTCASVVGKIRPLVFPVLVLAGLGVNAWFQYQNYVEARQSDARLYRLEQFLKKDFNPWKKFK